MSRWSEFRSFSDSIPQRPYEASVFVRNAIDHLLNSGRDWSGIEMSILTEALGRINDADWDTGEAA